MNVEKFIQKKLEELRNKGTLIAACSGGVDSSTAAYLANKAEGTNVKAFVIDDGLRRANEAKEAVDNFRELGIDIELLDKKKEFFTALEGVSDPEEKRKVFRETFYTVLQTILENYESKKLLQGTIKADIEETTGNGQERVKTQHNVLEQIGIDYGFKVIEPMKDLYKDEVRKVARELGLPPKISERMPFPGPGLAIRILGEVTPEKVEVIRKAHSIVEAELEERTPFQVFPILLNDRATGVRKGRRAYGRIIAIRCIESEDAMTAKPTRIPIAELEQLAEKICEKISEVNRVLYDVTPKPPGTIEFE